MTKIDDFNLSEKIKYINKEKYLQIGSDIDVWAKSKRIDFLEVKDIREFVRRLKEFCSKGVYEYSDVIDEINALVGKKL